MTMRELENRPLALEELEAMARESAAVWCVDSGGMDCGVLSMQENWWDHREAPFIGLPNEEGCVNQYSVEFMLELGARFYLRRPKGSAIRWQNEQGV